MEEGKVEYRRLSKDEIKSLSLELKICYYLCPWENNIKIKDLNDWCEHFYMLFDVSDCLLIQSYDYKTDTIISMKGKHKKLYDFVKMILPEEK